MRVKDLGTRTVPASVRDFLSRLGREPQQQRQVVRIERREIPYWQERGWKQTGRTYRGSYQTPYGAFEGYIEQERSGRFNFYLYNPPGQLRDHSHWTCFQHRGNDWYLVHMAKEPRDLGSGIMTIEKLMTEAYE
jgi:hypothetical protein